MQVVLIHLSLLNSTERTAASGPARVATPAQAAPLFLVARRVED